METNNDKLRFNCYLTKLDKEISIEADQKMTLRTLKKKIREEMNLEKSIKIFHNEKDLTLCGKIKLCELFKNHMIETEDKFNTKENLIMSSGNSNIEPINLTINLNTKKKAKSSKSEKRLKYMLECNLHPNENAHFYCFTCKLSFCTLCIDEHHPHDFIDKYEYSKSNEELVNGLIEDCIVSIKKLEGSANYYNSSSKNQISFLNSTEELKNIYNELISNNQMLIHNKNLKKIEDFKNNMLKEHFDTYDISLDDSCKNDCIIIVCIIMIVLFGYGIYLQIIKNSSQ